MNFNLSNLSVGDLDNAKSQEFRNTICPAGEHVAKVIGFTEEETYNYVTLEIDKRKYNFFYDYFIRGTEDLNADVLNWLKSLATIPLQKDTKFMEITNSAIGQSYKIQTYTYTSKSGKNKGKENHAIDFRFKPELTTVEISEEEYEFPY